MQTHLIEEATKIIPIPQVLINVISKRVRQLASGHRPMVETGAFPSFSDVALQEVIEGKLTFEMVAPEPTEA